MKVFLSWSKERSRRLAAILAGWLPDVIQAVDPFFSQDDIDKGTFWAQELSSTLKGDDIGILVVTPENRDNPWLLFEAGALSKNAGKARVTPLLFGVTMRDIAGNPLSILNAAEFGKDEMLRLIQGLNRALESTGEKSLPADVLVRSFDRLWPELDQNIQEVLAIEPSEKAPPSPSQGETLEHILESLKRLEQHVSAMNSIKSPNEAAIQSAAQASHEEQIVETNLSFDDFRLEWPNIKVIVGDFVRSAYRGPELPDIASQIESFTLSSTYTSKRGMLVLIISSNSYDIPLDVQNAFLSVISNKFDIPESRLNITYRTISTL